MCHNRQLYPVWVFLLFLILIYLGKSVFEMTWMYMGLGSALLLILHLKNLGPANCCRPATWYWMALIVYQLHQFEEHGIDLYGTAYAFEGFFNQMFSHFSLGCPVAQDCPLNPENILYVNMLVVWLPLLIATHVAERRPGLAACYVGIIPANALVHIVAGLYEQAYNPGLLTAVLLFLPFSFCFYRKTITMGYIKPCQAVLSFIFGVIGHPVIVLALIPTYIKHDLPEMAYPFILLAYILLPFLVSCAKSCGGCTTSCDTSSCACCGSESCNCDCQKSMGCCAQANCDCCSKKKGCGCTNPNCQCACKKLDGEKKVVKKAPAKKKTTSTASKAKTTKPKQPK